MGKGKQTCKHACRVEEIESYFTPNVGKHFLESPTDMQFKYTWRFACVRSTCYCMCDLKVSDMHVYMFKIKMSFQSLNHYTFINTHNLYISFHKFSSYIRIQAMCRELTFSLKLLLFLFHSLFIVPMESTNLEHYSSKP